MADPLPRRRALQIAAAAVVPAVAGCLGTEDDGQPWYTDWLPDSNGILFAAVELTVEPQSENEPPLMPLVLPNIDDEDKKPSQRIDVELSDVTDVGDPLVKIPFTTGATNIAFASVGLAVANLFAVIDTPDKFDSDPSRLLFVNGTTIVTGKFDRAELGDRLTDDSGLFTVAYEDSGKRRGYDRYTPTERPDSVENPPAVAIDDSTILTARDEEGLTRIIDTVADDRPLAIDESETLTWLVEEIETGDLVVGEIGTPPVEKRPEEGFTQTDQGFEPAAGEDTMAAVDLDPGTEAIEVRFALAADDLDDTTRETVETAFGTAGRERSVEINENRLTADATYDGTDIGVGVSEGSSGREREQLSESAARELVPEGGLEFWYVPPIDREFGEFWVAVVVETDAAAIRVEANSGTYNEIRPREGSVGPDIEIAAQVDPDGDEVTVFAVDDEDAIGELTTERVPTDELSDRAAEQAVPTDALSFAYEEPDTGELGTLSVEVRRGIVADALVAESPEKPFTDRIGSLDGRARINSGSRLRLPVDPSGEVVVFATVDGATGEVARWDGT